jgi:hypothetical protein
MMPCLRGRSLAAEPRSGNELAQLLMEKAAGDEKILFRLRRSRRSANVLAPNRERWPGSKPSTAQSRRQTEIKVYAVGNPPR